MRWLIGGNPLLLLGHEEVVVRFAVRMSLASLGDYKHLEWLWPPDPLLPGALLVYLASVRGAPRVLPTGRCRICPWSPLWG